MEELIGYEGLYKIDTDGNIYSIKYDKILKFYVDKDGYRLVRLCKQSKYKTLRIHRLVAMQFIENPLNLPEVDHIDNNTGNNKLCNLQWVTRSDNHKLAYKRGKIPCKHWLNKKGKLHNCSKKIYCQLLNKVFDGIKEAARITGIDDSAIIKSCKKVLNKNGTVKSAGKHPLTKQKLYWDYYRPADFSKF